VVENLEMQRAPQPTLDGVYFITPSEDSVKRVVEDCKQALYRKAHVFFYVGGAQGGFIAD
jgi:syntaxin-binding protein 1